MDLGDSRLAAGAVNRGWARLSFLPKFLRSDCNLTKCLVSFYHQALLGGRGCWLTLAQRDAPPVRVVPGNKSKALPRRVVLAVPGSAHTGARVSFTPLADRSADSGSAHMVTAAR